MAIVFSPRMWITLRWPPADGRAVNFWGKTMRLARSLALCVVISCGGSSVAAADPKVPQHDNLNAVLWMQSSAEYKALALSTYAAARVALDRALADPEWTAALEQGAGYQTKPPAIILDLDETVFDNSAYMAWQVRTGTPFGAQSFGDFIEVKLSEPIPGAVEYVRYAMSRGVTHFFISNRNARLKEATRDTLVDLGILPAVEKSILLKRERRDWGMQKGNCRAEKLRALVPWK